MLRYQDPAGNEDNISERGRIICILYGKDSFRKAHHQMITLKGHLHENQDIFMNLQCHYTVCILHAKMKRFSDIIVKKLVSKN